MQAAWHGWDGFQRAAARMHACMRTRCSLSSLPAASHARHPMPCAAHPCAPACSPLRALRALCVAGMEYLHNCKPMLVHRDLKSPNLLVDRDWTVKVCE